MEKIDTYTLMLELCRRIADYQYDPEPTHDSVLETLTIQLGDLQSLHSELYEYTTIYKSTLKIKESE